MAVFSPRSILKHPPVLQMRPPVRILDQRMTVQCWPGLCDGTTHSFASKCCSLVAGALKECVAELRKDEESRIARLGFPQVYNEACPD